MASSANGSSTPSWEEPVWQDVDRTLGQLFMMGFDGHRVTPGITKLIQEHHIGSILLVAKNLKSAEETTRLCYELQNIAYEAGHPVPLLIGTDQENGGVNSLFDETYIRQYPSLMGIAATGSNDLAYEVAKATAQEISACGLNLIMGPCLDVLANARSQPLGVRTAGDDPQQVSAYGISFMKGYKAAGIATLGKHFPSYGNLEFLGAATDVPTITESLEQLSLSALVPFRNAIQQGLDSVMVGGVAMSSVGLNVMHACLSEQVVDGLLRHDLGFDGVVVSECLEMEALSHNIGVGGGTVMAVNAGCDLILLCRAYPAQIEAIKGIKTGLENGIIEMSRIQHSLRRMLTMKSKCTSWEKALNPPGVSALSLMQPSHQALSSKAYNSSITLVRDKNHFIPLSNTVAQDEEICLLTPLVKPLAASAEARNWAEGQHAHSPPDIMQDRTSAVMTGERVFRELGRSLARQRNGRVLHTSYTANGVRPTHETLINRASAVIVVTADANRNIYQQGFTKHVNMICQQFSSTEKKEKPLVVISVSSPYDFAYDPAIGTYICTYDFTETALYSLVRVLYGDHAPIGALPGTTSESQKLHQTRQHWLVEAFNEERDANSLDALIKLVVQETPPSQRSELLGATSSTFLLHNPDVLETHFVVRNSSTHALYGFCSTYYFRKIGTGAIGALFVDPSRRKLSIGHSLHLRAIRTLLQRDEVKRFALGTRLPSVYLGIPLPHTVEKRRLRAWFANLGWNTALSRTIYSMVARDLSSWNTPDGMAKSLQSAGGAMEFDMVSGWDFAEPILDHVRTSNRQGLLEVYKLALTEPSTCAIIRAKRPSDKAILGTVVLYSGQSRLAEFVPAMRQMEDQRTGGISSPVIAPGVADYSIMLQGLILLGIKQTKKNGCGACILDYMDGDGNVDSLKAMGFEVLHDFEEVSCDAATWQLMPPSAYGEGSSVLGKGAARERTRIG